jgi:S-adenosylmethionine:tRNA ribosyltransferase-isomerase
MKDFINIQDYTYILPAEKIAATPLAVRDASKLLVYKQGNITHAAFNELADFLPENAFLFFNDTKVIPARLLFKKDTGADIEIFLLNPVAPSTIMAEVMTAKGKCTWHCTIGNLKRWKNGQPLIKEINGGELTALLINRSEGLIELRWSSNHTFAEVVTLAGITPLPPYIKREASAEDINRYQTVYSHYEGAVAAPTAGLHFTDNVFESLQQKGIGKDFVTLHVSAGTFQPVKAENALEHTMHHEQVVITRSTIENLMDTEKFVVAVGTTSMRTLESLYWFGVKLLADPNAEFSISQTDPYQNKNLPSSFAALKAVAKHLDKHRLTNLIGVTSIFIYPGYSFQLCKGLITNFHLPASTLMLLVAAFVGDDWKKIYGEALDNHYRFLSYGDSSLLLP